VQNASIGKNGTRERKREEEEARNRKGEDSSSDSPFHSI
jgi:hypothetical protein